MHRPDPHAGVRTRLFGRVAASAAAARVMHTRRSAPTRGAERDGIVLSELYRATAAKCRPGEPRRVRLLQRAPGATWRAGSETGHAEWLVMEGSAAINGRLLAELGFLRGSEAGWRLEAGPRGACVLLREADGDAAAFVQHDSPAAWHDFAPGIRRRMLHEHAGLAAMLYRTQPEATVARHAHHHDEECLMLQGDLFLDDVLLRPLDYQLAPAGSGHASVYTDTGVLLYAHGDAELDLLPG
jgi:quercetin dioxygenase-like cupin family protein